MSAMWHTVAGSHSHQGVLEQEKPKNKEVEVHVLCAEWNGTTALLLWKSKGKKELVLFFAYFTWNFWVVCGLDICLFWVLFAEVEAKGFDRSQLQLAVPGAWQFLRETQLLPAGGARPQSRVRLLHLRRQLRSGPGRLLSTTRVIIEVIVVETFRSVTLCFAGMDTSAEALLYKHTTQENTKNALCHYHWAAEFTPENLRCSKPLHQAPASRVLHHLRQRGEGVSDAGEEPERGVARSVLGRRVYSRVSGVRCIGWCHRLVSQLSGELRCHWTHSFIPLSVSSDIPPDIDSYTISIYNKGKRSKDTEVGECCFVCRRHSRHSAIAMVVFCVMYVCEPFAFCWGISLLLWTLLSMLLFPEPSFGLLFPIDKKVQANRAVCLPWNIALPTPTPYLSGEPFVLAKEWFMPGKQPWPVDWNKVCCEHNCCCTCRGLIDLWSLVESQQVNQDVKMLQSREVFEWRWPPVQLQKCSLSIAVSMMVNLDTIQPGESVDEWHNLIPVNLTFKGDVGSVRVKARYLHEVIMPLKEYTSLKEVQNGRAHSRLSGTEMRPEYKTKSLSCPFHQLLWWCCIQHVNSYFSWYSRRIWRVCWHSLTCARTAMTAFHWPTLCCKSSGTSGTKRTCWKRWRTWRLTEKVSNCPTDIDLLLCCVKASVARLFLCFTCRKRVNPLQRFHNGDYSDGPVHEDDWDRFCSYCSWGCHHKDCWNEAIVWSEYSTRFVSIWQRLKTRERTRVVLLLSLVCLTKSEVCFQINPACLENPADVEVNVKHLINILNETLNAIFKSIEACPP